MKIYFFISNRQSGKTTKAIYEFLKDPENTLFICADEEKRKYIVKSVNFTPSECNNIISASRIENVGRGHRRDYKRIIYDEYLLLDYETRFQIHCATVHFSIEEIFCFSTPERLYNKSTFEFVTNLKKEGRVLVFENSKNNLCFTDVLVEITNTMIRTSDNMKEEIYDLFHNYLTNPETKIIHQKFFFNKKLYNIENVSYFPDFYKELTELKGQFINETDSKGFIII